MVVPTWINLENHGLTTGQAVRDNVNGGTAIGGLTENTVYYVRVGDVPAGGVQLAPTQKDAINGTRLIVLDGSAATGTKHSLTPQQGAAQPISFSPATAVASCPRRWVDLACAAW